MPKTGKKNHWISTRACTDGASPGAGPRNDGHRKDSHCTKGDEMPLTRRALIAATAAAAAAGIMAPLASADLFSVERSACRT